MSRASREAAARIRAAEASDRVESRRERARQDSTRKVVSTRGQSDVQARMGQRPAPIRATSRRTDRS